MPYHNGGIRYNTRAMMSLGITRWRYNNNTSSLAAVTAVVIGHRRRRQPRDIEVGWNMLVAFGTALSRDVTARRGDYVIGWRSAEPALFTPLVINGRTWRLSACWLVELLGLVTRHVIVATLVMVYATRRDY